MLCEAFGEHSLSQTAVFEWYSCFKASWVSVEDDERSVQPSTSKMTENVKKIRDCSPWICSSKHYGQLWLLKFWDAWKKMCDERDWNFGAPTTGSFIMTTCLPTLPWKPQSLWLTTTWLSFPIPRTCQT
jgi:hypothetical protein